MLVPPNLKIEFKANEWDSSVSPGSSVDAKRKPVVSRVQEIGQLNFYSSACPNNICDDVVSQKLTWNSSVCSNAGEAPCAEQPNSACKTPIPDNQFFDQKSGRLMQSMISCGSPFQPSFIGLDVSANQNSSDWKICRASTSDATLKIFEHPESYSTSYCRQGNSRTLEQEAYFNANQSMTPILRGCSKIQPWDSDSICLAEKPPDVQACSCLATRHEVTSTPARAETNTFIDGSWGFKKWTPTPCGLVNQCEVGETGGTSSDTVGCQCINKPTLDGSVREFKISLVDDNNRPVTWERLQAEYCVSGLSIAGFPIQRYTDGSPACDRIMRQACANTAELTLDNELLESCGCILEERRLRAQFAGIDLPIQCFTTVCDLNNQDVYKTAEQVTGCSARACEQAISVHGSAILAKGFQELICHGTVYQVSEVAENPPAVPLVSQADATGSDLVLGPEFYIAIGLLVVLLVVVVVWGVRRGREVKRQKLNRQKDAETLLLKSLNQKPAAA
jgi:hypothetical protein